MKINNKQLTALALILYLIPFVTIAFSIDFYASKYLVTWPFNHTTKYMHDLSWYFYIYGFLTSVICFVISLSSSDENLRRLFKFVWMPYLLPIALLALKKYLSNK